MTTYTARENGTGNTYRFRSIDALAHRLGGNDWQAEHETTFRPAYRTVMILRRGRQGYTHIVTTIRVPSEALTA